MTETKAVAIVHPSCITFKEAILKKVENEGMYKIIASITSVARLTILKRVFLFLKVLKTEK